MSAILGAGVLVLPGQVASMAGPASLAAWAIAGLLGVPLAVTFAALARRYPDAGGVASYAGASFGPTIGGITGWCYFVAGSVGQTIVPLTGGYYVANAVHQGSGVAFAVAALILGVATGANLVGLRVSARVQLILALSVGVALLVVVGLSIPRMSAGHLVPFAPNGFAPIGSAVVVLFFAFAGWEAIAHLAGEFRNPHRDVPRAVAATVVIVSVLYLGTACAVVLTGTYGSPAVDRVAIGILLHDALGSAATPIAAVVAVVISLGTTNAFIAGVSRLGHSLSEGRWLPRPVAAVNRHGVPAGGILAVAGLALAGLALAYWRNWGTDALVVVPATLVVVVYLIAAAAAARVFTGWPRCAAITTLAITTLVLPTATQHVVIPAIVVAAALICRTLVHRHDARTTGKGAASCSK